MTNQKARAVGINHVALDVGDIDEALEFYGLFLNFRLRSRDETMAVIDLGDQFLALTKSEAAVNVTDGRHFGLVVDDREAVRMIVQNAGIKILSDRFLDFRDPWGNMIEIISYGNIQFSKTEAILRGMELQDLEKNDKARTELRDRGFL